MDCLVLNVFLTNLTEIVFYRVSLETPLSDFFLSSSSFLNAKINIDDGVIDPQLRFMLDLKIRLKYKSIYDNLIYNTQSNDD